MNLLGIDFEDWYHPQLVEPFVSKEKRIPIMFKGLDKILNLLRKTNSKATFFIVGELLKSNPEILDKISSEGHEIGFHTMHHTRLDLFTSKINFQNEIKEFENLTSGKSKGFRAPTFSLNKKSSWVIDELVKSNYTYDSSVVPAKTNLYGIPDAEKSPYKIDSSNLSTNNENGNLIEFPLLVTKLFGKTIPASGGFYLRFLPLKIIKNAIESYEKRNIPASMYVHSWELTPEYIPKIDLPFKNKFITFYNIKKTYSKINELLNNFNFNSFDSYLSKL